MITIEDAGEWFLSEGFEFEKGEADGVGWLLLGRNERTYRCAVHIDNRWVSMMFRFPGYGQGLSVDGLMNLLGLNNEMFMFKFALDDRDRLYILVSWPVENLRFITLGYLAQELEQNVDYFFDRINYIASGQ